MSVRVALVGPHPLPGSQASGGVEVVMVTLVGALRDLGAHVTVVTCAAGRDRRSFEHDGVTYATVPTERARGRLTWYTLERRAIRRELESRLPDVVHVQGANLYGPAALSAGLPTVVTVHGILHREGRITDSSSGMVERVSKRLRGVGNAYFERWTLRDASDVVIINPYVEEAVGGLTRARLHHVPNPVADAFYAVHRRPERGRLLFVGTIEPVKNVLMLVRAFASTRDAAPDARLHIVGPRRDAKYHAAVLAEIQASGDGRTSYRGLLHGDALCDEYASAELLVLPSRHESSPLAVQQAMAAGVPVLGARVGGVAHLVDDGRTGALVAPGDERGLAAALVSLLRGGELTAMGRRARAGAERFREGAVAATTLEVYADVIADSARRRPRTARGRTPRSSLRRSDAPRTRAQPLTTPGAAPGLP